MRFIDTTGHIFSMKSYKEMPLGYEYEQTPYIFWIDGEYSQKLSVNNYYILPVRVLVKQVFYNDIKQDVKLKINVTSDVFKLYCPEGELGEKEITLNELVSEITDINKLNCITDLTFVNAEDYDPKFDVYTFYVVANTKTEGTWSTNVLIELDTYFVTENNLLIDIEEFCPITVAGTFIDEIEQLQINSKNIGVSLPKSIIKAVYQHQYNTDVIDEVAYNNKLKEYLINHMLLKAECGNYNAVLRAIDWFGWKDKLSISKLLKTDNEFVEQFINDSFTIEDDIIECFKKFKSSAYISLFVDENRELDTINKPNFDNEFWGESKPELEDLFNKTTVVEKHGISFIKQYYDYTFTEMGVKLSCLAHMLKKYFLPVHLSIKTAALRHQVFANDIKLLNNTSVVKTEQPVFASIDLQENRTFVSFDNNYTYYLHTQKSDVFIDTNFNNFSHYTKEFCENSSETFISAGSCISASIPIYFSCFNLGGETNYQPIYNCTILLEQIAEDNTSSFIYTSNFSFIQDTNSEYNNFVIVPERLQSNSGLSNWENKKYILHVKCNGIWYKKEFMLQIPDLQITFNRLQYNYEHDKFKQIAEISNNEPRFIYDMYLEDLVTINNAHFVDEYTRAYNLRGNDNASINYYMNLLTERIKITDNKKYYNRIHIYDLSIKSFTNDNKDILTYNESDLSIYNDFFTTNGEQLYNLSVNGNQDLYDFYLMRDKSNKYYGVFISKDTIGTNANLVSEKQIEVIKPENSNYNFHKLKSDELFLINRMILVYDNGIHKFSTDDIISLDINNIDLPFILSLGTKWTIKNISIGSEYVDEINSKTNTAIVSIPENQVKYAKGFYDVTVSYTLDNYNKSKKTLTQQICIQ